MPALTLKKLKHVYHLILTMVWTVFYVLFSINSPYDFANLPRTATNIINTCLEERMRAESLAFRKNMVKRSGGIGNLPSKGTAWPRWRWE